jgi:single-stranded-DNA-specific exonuclease
MFNVDRAKWPNSACERVRLAYRLDLNYFRGVETLQLRIEAIKAL